MQIDKNYFGYWLLIIFVNHTCIPHIICMCIRVAAAAEEIVYEVVAEPQESQGQALQQEDREEPAQFTLALSSRRKASPGVHPIILNYDIYICIYYLCITFRSCLEP